MTLHNFAKYVYHKCFVSFNAWCYITNSHKVIWKNPIVWFDSLRPSQKFSVILGWVFLGWTSTKQGLMCLAQEQITVTSVRLELTAPQSQVKHSTTEPLCSLISLVYTGNPKMGTLTTSRWACALITKIKRNFRDLRTVNLDIFLRI